MFGPSKQALREPHSGAPLPRPLFSCCHIKNIKKKMKRGLGVVKGSKSMEQKLGKQR